MSGYARAWRSRWEHPAFKSKQEAAVWAWMCDTARFREHTFQTRFGPVTLQRGQILVSQRTIAEDFGLGRQQVRRLMDSLGIAGMITENSTHSASRAGTIITITNYERYQQVGDDDIDAPTQRQPKRQPITNPRPTQDQPTREESKEREEREDREGTREARSAGSALAVDGVGAAFTDWQALRREIRPGSRTVALTDARRKALAARLRDHGPDGWKEALAAVRRSAFLRGDTERWGGAEIDWMLNPKNYAKVLEGNYDDRSGRQNGQPAGGARPGGGSVPTSTVDALRIARVAAGFGGP